jgi:hypothetical protein
MIYKNCGKILLALIILFLSLIVDEFASMLASEKGFDLDISARFVTPIYFALLVSLTLFLVYVIAKEKNSITLLNLFVFLILSLKVYHLGVQFERGDYEPYTQALKKIE